MGQSRRQQPARLAGKLKEIRLKLELTQEQMAKHLHKVKAGLQSGHVSEYESGKREPLLIVLLAYARLAGISTDYLIDDKLDLPKNLPYSQEKRH
ncbi:MAG: helix-turn-helix domain-containing protein [Blastocatellia bacterium]